MGKRKEKELDVEISAGAKMKSLHVEKKGKVETAYYSNVKHQKVYEEKRINLPKELKEGETYTDAGIETFRGVRVEDKE